MTVSGNSKKKAYAKSAANLTILSMASTGILFLWYVLGPQTGMETLAVIVPWLFALVVNFAAVIPAIVCARKSRGVLIQFLVYGYFMTFWVWHGIIFIQANEVDVHVARKIDSFQMPAETELVATLAQMRIEAFQKSDIDPVRVAHLKTMIENGADVTYLQPGAYREMILDAAAIGDPELLELMIEKGANVDAGGSGAPLMEAVRSQKPRAAAVLLKHGADPNHERYNPDTPLMLAVRNQDMETLLVLLDGGAQPDKHAQSSQPPLQIAARNGDAPAMKLLLDAGADPGRIFFGKFTALIQAIEADCPACVQILLDAGGRFVGKSRDDDGVLALTVKRGNPEIIACIRNAVNHSENPALLFGVETFEDMFRAIRRSDWTALEAFLELGAPPDIVDADGNTLLLKIAGRKYVRPDLSPESELAAAKILFRYEADLDATDKWGKNALIRAAESGAVDLGKWLIDKGAYLNAQSDPDGISALIKAIWNGDDALAFALINAGADPNTRTRWKMNSEGPLEAAVKKGNVDLVMRLLEAGASPNPGRLAYEPVFSMALASPRMLELLVNSGLDLNQKDIFDRYPLEIVMQNGSIESIGLMIESGADPYLKDWRGTPPFLSFAKTGRADLVRLCLEKSPSILQNREFQKEAMYIAMHNGQTTVVGVLLEQEPFYSRMEDVNAVLKNAIPPADDPNAIHEIRTLFEKRLEPGKQGTDLHSRTS
jgi:ankyrin repeat protein